MTGSCGKPSPPVFEAVSGAVDRSVYSADGATSVSLGTAIQVDFNRPLNPNTVLLNR